MSTRSHDDRSGDAPSDPDGGESRPRRSAVRARGLFLRLVVLCLVVEAAYLLAGNAFLRMDWGQEAISKEGKRLISWEDAWTPLPGVVRVEGFELRARTPKVTWRLAIDEAWMWMAPLELLGKSFHVRWIRAAGGASQVRLHGRDPAGQPTVGGFGDSAPPAPRDGDRRPWRLAFDDVEVRRLGELWIGPLRHRPSADVPPAREGVARGRLLVVVRRSVELPRLDVELAPGRADAGEEIRAEVERLTFDGRVEAFDPSALKGAARLGRITGHLAVETREGSLGLLEQFFRGTPAAVEADGELEASLHLHRGVLRAPSRLRIGEGILRGRYLGWRAEGRGQIGGRVAADGSARVEARLAEAELRRGETPIADARDVYFDATSERADLAEPSPSMEIRARLPTTEVEDLGVFDRYLPQEGPIRLSGGRGTLEAAGHLVTRAGEADGGRTTEPSQDVRFSGHLSLVADGLRGRVRGQEMQGDLRLEVKVPWIDVASRSAGIDGTRLEVRRVRGGGIRDWWADVDVRSGRARSGEAWGLRGEVEARVADSSPVLALVTGQHPRLSVLDRLLTVHGLDLEAEVRSDAESAQVRDAVLRGPGSTRVLGELRFARGGHEMLLHASWGPFALGVFQGRRDVEVDLRHSLEWFEARQATFWE